ncbi:hypothetical protein MKS88_001295 [Plasmodium brasilianum]|uniref:Uncharacterized protein n=2 Tax=Plasmodium (Plasmodium) TaxID=418103 RepID=A0A1A8VTH4_PLAMA|nr:conserved Plasmodium protein, unknown function [Plasmodium malariae]KAI4839943.1 hypothetical protein MKS88_001295 [Plasmodium brasilianum]SBS82638.1 conserved Plasmodium protein, unknown function [Plasmodium malariae]SBT87311.1 conserved Plasmodium protein, unknown function [Plasmodium malariae]
MKKKKIKKKKSEAKGDNVDSEVNCKKYGEEKNCLLELSDQYNTTMISNSIDNTLENNDIKKFSEKLKRDNMDKKEKHINEEYDQRKPFKKNFVEALNDSCISLKDNVGLRNQNGKGVYKNEDSSSISKDKNNDDNDSSHDNSRNYSTNWDEEYYEKTLQGENDMSDISTDEILSGLETESGIDDDDISGMLEDAKNRGGQELIYENLNNNELSALSEEIRKKEKILEEENKNIWNLKNRFSKIEKFTNLKKKKMKDLKKSIEDKTKIEEEENAMCKNIEMKNVFLNKENKKLKEEREKNNEKIIKTQNDLVKCDNDIEEIKKKLMCKENELNEWFEKINKVQKEEYEIEKFRLIKDKEIEKLSYNLEKLCLENVESEKNLNTLKTKNMKLNIELQATVNDNEDIKKEKKDLLKKWKCIVDAINNRDHTVMKFEEYFRKYLNKEQKLKQKYEHITKNIDAQKSKNDQLNHKIKETKMALNILRKEETNVNNTWAKVLIERDLLNKDYDHAKFNFKEKLEEKKNLENSLTELTKTWENLLESSEESKKELHKEELKNVEKNELIKSSEHILNEQKNKLNNLITEIKLLDEEKFRLSQVLQKSKNEYTTLESEVLGTHIKIKQMKNNIKKIEQELERQKEILYKFDFQIQVLTKKLNVVSGNSTFEKKKENQKKILTLEKELSKHEDIFNTLNNEIKRINVELKSINMHRCDLKDQNLDIIQECEKFQLEIKSLENTVNNENKEKENIMLIELNLKIELDKLKGKFAKHLDNLNILKDQKRENLKIAKLNEQDMNAHIESLRNIMKNINDEIHKLNIQVYDKKSKCNNLELKLNGIIAMNKEQDDENVINEESANKHIYYKIKIEEDIIKLKEELKKLDEQVDKENNEIQKFQKTLNDILQTNKTFSDNIKCIDPQYKLLFKKKKKLNKKLNEINEEITQIEKNINDYNKKVKVAENQLDNVLLESKSMEEQINTLKENSQKMEYTINDIFIKIERASNQLKNLIGTNKKLPIFETTKKDMDNKDDNKSENISLEKKIFKQIQMESLKEKISFLFECLNNCKDNEFVKEILNVVEEAQ